MSKFIFVLLFFVNIVFAQDNDTSLDEFKEKNLVDEDEVLNQLDKLNELSNRSMEFKPFIYSGGGRRSPFLKSGEVKRVESENKIAFAEEILQSTGLEGYDVSSFELTAVMWDIKHPKALVKDLGKEIYVIEEGTRIGRLNGYVAKIREGEVIIVEPNVLLGEKKARLYKTQVLKLGR